MPNPFAIIAGVAAIGSILSGNSARRSQKSAARAEAEIVAITNRQNRREFLQSFRDAQAQAVLGNIASLGGGYESSRGFSEPISLSTQKTLGLKEFDRQAALGQRAASKRIDASRYAFASSTFAQLGNFAQSPAGQDILS